MSAELKNINECTLEKKIEVVFLVQTFFEVQNSKTYLNTPWKKNSLKLFGLFQRFSWVQTLKRVINTHFYLKSFNCFEHFSGVYFLKK